MLEKHLIALTRPQANQKNIVLWKDYRITVLQDRLIRLEKSKNQIFRDEATQAVWYRDMQPQAFRVEEKDGCLRIKTKAVTLIVAKEREDCLIQMGEALVQIDNTENLFGTARTLDGYSGDVFMKFFNAGDGEAVENQRLTLEYGVCSQNGVAVIDDSSSLTLGKDGEVKPVKGDGTDEYIFAYGDDYRAAVKALYMICGDTPLIPRYALGNWWSRYYIYTDKEYLRLLNSFEEQEIPLTVATIDMDWHYSKFIDDELHITELGRNTEFCGGNNGWTGYTWNKNLFPDYKSFLRKIEDKDLKITLNLHPADGIRWWEDCYENMAKVVGADAENGEQVKFDMTNTDFINAYFSKIHKPYENDGVEFWWIDWQQGKTSCIEGLDPLWSLNHYHYLDHASNHSAALILSRYAGVGSHRYPLGFSGDSHITWETLDYLPYFTSTASNVGYTWWSHDIGGHMLGEKDDEMYLRHVQYGVFSPINRLHCSNTRVCTKEPWAYGNGAGELAKRWLRFRHRLIPYLYTASYHTYKEGIALVEPLYYEWKTPEAYKYKNEYFFGGQLLVAPVTTKLEADGYARTKLWIQEGTWTDIFTGAQYEAGKDGKEFTLLREMESIPVLIKAGGILPLSAEKGNSVQNPKEMEIQVWSGNGSYTLYEDGAAKETEGQVFTEFCTFHTEENGTGKQILTIKACGDENIIPEKRLLKVRFKNIYDGKIKLYIDGNQIEAEEVLTDCTAIDFETELGKEYRIEVEYVLQTKAEKLIAYARKTLTCAKGNLKQKNVFFKQILQIQSVEEYVALVQQTDQVSDTVKECLTEIL